ncbi:MAG TPA: tripartite tricarboxylate transporter substrate binding protein [Xanthobacteraceae bacterium]|jgi:tripartite-type tricarboxylate transporter receptor subunit TctC|nr:tripartite tricarboxylate transporter substrate binding protein [Xanthobacteraceae bacterium]
MLLRLSLLFAALTMALPAAAQEWPSRPLTMVVPFAAGGPMDALARILQPTLAEALGQTIVIENQPGGGGMTGSLRVAQAAPDSHLFVLASIGTHAIGYSMHKKPAYHPANDFQPVTFIADAPLLLMTKKDLPPNNLKEFTAYTKANQGKMVYSSGGTGTSSHISCVLLNQIMGVTEVAHVPYKGGGPAFADVVAGRIDYICNYVSIGAAAANQGQVKAIAMLAGERTPLLPNLPTANEQGLKDFDVSAWNAVLLPKSASPAQVTKLNAALTKALDDPKLRQRLDAIGLIAATPARRSPEYLRDFINAETKKWAAPVKASGVNVE